MPLALHCLSHTPVFGRNDAPTAVVTLVREVLDDVSREIAAFDPELIVLFAPDHFQGFFYNLMPAFCIGAVATSIGDYGSSAGPLPVPVDEALACAAACLADGVDVAVSRSMRVDHGFAQPLDLVCGGLGTYPVIPVFINAIGEPVAPIARSRALGAAIGKFIATRDRRRRVMVLASGGLSHDPPVPTLATAAESMRDAMIAGIPRDLEAQAAHERRVIAAARVFAEADPLVGGGDRVALSPDWDLRFLDLINAGRFDDIEAMRHDEMSAIAGGSSHEVRTWVAAYACLAAYGDWSAATRFYRPIPQWMAGFAIASGNAA